MTTPSDLVIWSGSEGTVTNIIFDLEDGSPHRQCVSMLHILIADMAYSANVQAHVLFVETILIIPSYLKRLIPTMAKICSSPSSMPEMRGTN